MWRTKENRTLNFFLKIFFKDFFWHVLALFGVFYYFFAKLLYIRLSSYCLLYCLYCYIAGFKRGKIVGKCKKKKNEFFSYHAYSRIIHNRVWNRIYYFEIAVSLNFEQGTSKSGKLKWKHRQTSLEFFHSWFSSFNWQKCGNVKIIFPVLYHIIHNSDLGQGKNQKIFHLVLQVIV